MQTYLIATTPEPISKTVRRKRASELCDEECEIPCGACGYDLVKYWQHRQFNRDGLAIAIFLRSDLKPAGRPPIFFFLTGLCK